MNYTPIMIVVNTVRKPLELAQETFGGQIFFVKKKPPCNDIYRYVLQGRALRPALIALRPYLTIKRAQVDKILEFISLQRQGGRHGYDPARRAYLERLCLEVKGMKDPSVHRLDDQEQEAGFSQACLFA